MNKIQKAKALFGIGACLSFIASVYLWFIVDRDQGMFVGLWVPSILALGALMTTGRRVTS